MEMHSKTAAAFKMQQSTTITLLSQNRVRRVGGLINMEETVLPREAPTARLLLQPWRRVTAFWFKGSVWCVCRTSKSEWLWIGLIDA